MLTLVEIHKGEKLLSREDTDPPCCIVLSGRFRTVLHGEQEGEYSEDRMLGAGSTCGNFQYFARKRWMPMDVVCVDEESAVAVFKAKELARLLAVESSNAQFKSLLGFLAGSIPGFEQLSGHSKERLCRFFKEVVYLPNKAIISEGQTPSSAYLIKEGVCMIISKQNPLFYNAAKKIHYTNDNEHGKYPSSYSVKRIVNNTLSSARTLRGSMSLSTNLSQLRNVGEKEWLGEETLLLEEMPEFRYDYSAIARTKVVVLEISRESLKKFPFDIMEWFKRNAHCKILWHKQRKSDLSNAVKGIYRMDPMTHFLDEALGQVTKRFPQASHRLTNEIHKQNFLVPVESEDEGARTGRQSVGLVPEFDYLRVLMNAKKQQGRYTDRPLTVQQKPKKASAHRYTADSAEQRAERNILSAPKEKREKTREGGERDNVISLKRELPQPQQMALRSTIQFSKGNTLHPTILAKVSMNLTLIPNKLKSKKDNEKYQQSLYNSFGYHRARRLAKQVLLENAATFRMSYDNKASFPTVFVKPPPPRVLVAQTEETENANMRRMKVEIDMKHNTFRVGLRNIQLVEQAKRPPSPNEARVPSSAKLAIDSNYD
eukprot:TRINITY_DN12704_c0_g2_i1.p1 TRINITY_DN12704_c0_g2~~TRINITY_DN12704_c0_g2_i1.p1  ORF type:complete len:599 (-),score=162.89 TRINITY_DN12704_c0_g2_i1:86-1882(-)